MSPSQAIYACSAHHWRYVLDGLVASGLQPDLLRPFEVTPRMQGLVDRPGMPSKLRTLAKRRSGRPPSPGRSLGPGEFVMPALIHTGTPISPAARRLGLDMQARRVARQTRHTRNLRVLQFTDGLGHRVAREDIGDIAVVCERRNLHHNAFTVDLAPLLDLPYEPLGEDPIEEFLEYEYALADVIHVYSRFAAQTFTDRGIDPARLMVSPLPAPQPRSRPDIVTKPAAPFLFVGRCEAVKGIDLAVAATQLVDARLLVAGPATEEVQRWLHGFAHVDYIGVADRATLDRVMSDAQALLMPSFESYGLVLLEAAALGLPVVASSTTGAGEYLSLDVLGLEVTRRTADAWAERLTELASASLDWRQHVVESLEVSLASLDEQHCASSYALALNSAFPALSSA